MDEGVKETLCSNCSHMHVCTYSEKYNIALKEVDSIKMGEIFSADLKCRHYEKRMPNARMFGQVD